MLRRSRCVQISLKNRELSRTTVTVVEILINKKIPVVVSIPGSDTEKKKKRERKSCSCPGDHCRYRRKVRELNLYVVS